MKRISLFMLTISLYTLSSCNTGQSNSAETIRKNLFAANSIDKALETGDVSHLGDYIQPDAIDHSDMNGDVKGLDQIKKGLSEVHTLAKNDIKFQVIKEVADTAYVFQWLRISGTAATGDMGVPIGQRFEINEVGVSRYKDGKATDYWEYMRAAEIMKMLKPAKNVGN
jgi:ketosteroid isomerase-like protein